jgi:hypothetical protein
VVVRSLLPRSKKLRTALLVAGSLVVVAVVVAILVILADSGTKGNPAKPPSVPAKKQAVADVKKRSLELVMGKVEVQNTGFPAAVRPRVRAAVMAATQQYFDDAIQAPLRTGKVNNGYVKVFDARVNGPAARRDRATLTEAATGPIQAPVSINSSRVHIDGLGDPSGSITLVATSFNLEIKARTPTGTLRIVRRTELTFMRDSGAWRVTAYRVTVRRSVGHKSTSTTARSGPGTTT